ncbi:MAG: flagellar hook capping FlgD N-terminal domain-containing protein [Desulfuromonadaceae bacterium]|nr:flagellar hook capping FlgD N-terminal domain-containing protein [Desulfuromonadaceae bacterium]
MVSSVGTTASSANDSAAAAAAMKKTTGLNKDDFLQLFVTQLKNQDPLNPQDSSQFVTQLAQLTQVEQAYNSNTNLQNLLAAVKGASGLNASSMIGRNVTALGNSVNFSGTATQLSYDLPAATDSTTVTITDGAGKTVRTFNPGAKSSGANSIVWDGKNDSGALVSPGSYTFAVTGKASDGSTITGKTFTTGKVDGIAFNGTDPVIKIGNIEIPMSSLAGIS